MAFPTNVPVVADIHWDDIAQLFKLRITWELMSPAGNKRGEVWVTAATLYDVFTKILELWAAVPAIADGAVFGALLGDPNTFKAFIDAMPTITEVTITPPGPYADTGSFVPATTYDGVADGWGATP